MPFAIEAVRPSAVIPIADICRFPRDIHGNKNDITDAMVAEMEANATLIAAAPDLRAALGSILPGLVHLVAIAPIPTDQKAEWEKAIEKGKAALRVAGVEP